MTIFIRCQWLAPLGQSICTRIAETGQILSRVGLVAIVGPRWFLKGSSRTEALKNEVALGDLGSNPKLLERLPLGDDEVDFTLHVWNGRATEEGATFGLTLHEPPSHPDGMVIGVEMEFLRSVASWDDVLGTARSLSREFGGCAIVSSHELLREAKRRRFPHNENDFPYAAYAVFWGVDRSGHNPLHRWLTARGRAVPFEAIACNSWEEAFALPERPLRALAEHIEDVATAAGGGVAP